MSQDEERDPETTLALPVAQYYYSKVKRKTFLTNLAVGLSLIYIAHARVFSIAAVHNLCTGLLQMWNNTVESLHYGIISPDFLPLYLIVTLLLGTAGVVMYIFLSNIKDVPLLVLNPPLLRFSEEGLYTRKHGLLNWENIIHIKTITRLLPPSKYSVDDTPQTTTSLFIFLDSSQFLEYSLDYFDDIEAIQNIVTRYDNHYKKANAEAVTEKELTEKNNLKVKIFLVVLLLYTIPPIASGIYALFGN